MKKGFTTFLSALKANTLPCKKGLSSLRFLSIFLILFLAVGNVWGADFTPQQIIDGATSGHVSVSSAIATSTSSQKVCNTNTDVVSINGSANGNGDAKYIQIQADEDYTISSLSLDASINKTDNNTYKIGVVFFSGVYAATVTDKAEVVIANKNATSGCGPFDISVPAGTRTVRIYRAIKINGDNQFNGSGTQYGSGQNTYVAGISATAVSAATYSVTYNLNGGTGSPPTQEDVAEGKTFTLHNGVDGITAPSGKKFGGWHDGTDKYAGGAEYTMGTSDVALTAQWVENVPDPTATFADASYIIGASALDMSAKFTSNSSGSVTYSLKEATSDASITSAGSFTATVAGTYVVVASQEAVAGTYAAISKEATVTVLDSEVADTYIWKKATGYTGCVASPNADAPAAQYTDIAYEGFTGMGRASTDNTECILTFTVKDAYSATFGIKSICTYGKLEEPAGGQISWDGGTNWEDLAAYAEGKKEFTAPAATYPTSFKIRFLGVSASSGGLYWRNALVTLQVKKTVTGTVEELTNVKVNDAAIDAADLATLMADKSLAITTTYATAPTVTFVKQVTTSYSGGWPDDVTSEEIDVEASDITTAWSASATINAQKYTVTLAKPAGPSLETEATAFTLTSAKVATDTKKFTFSGVNLTSGNVTISLENAVAGMTVAPTVVTPEAGAITDQDVTITYKSLEAVAEANVNLVVYYDADTKITIPLTYSSTAGVEDLTPISAATTWNWDGAASAAVGTVIDKAQMIILANADVTWDEGFNAHAIAGKLEYMCRDNKFAQGDELMFKTTIPGKVYVTYSNTGGNDPRTVNVNGTKGSLSSSNNKDADKRTESFAVSAGDVLIKGVQVSDDAAKYLRYYEVRFAPVFAVTYAAGDGEVKSGETLPTQADEAAGEKIILAAATALEKDGYDFAGWLCNIDAHTYQPGDEYTMTAAATTFTAQWVVHVDPVDPTLTYNNGAYMTGGAALDLSTLITASNSTGAITYSVKDAGTTGATIDGKNFTATAAGTATITASQAAILGYNAITVDFEVVVTEATEIDGIKMVEAGALTGNFRIKADQLKTGDNTVEGINYTKYVQMSSTHTSFSGETEGSQSKGIYYAPAKKNIKFWFYMRNTDSSARKIYIYKMEEGSAVSSETVSVDAGLHLVSYDMTLSTNAEVIFGVEDTKLCFCQIVAVESGDDLLQGGQNGYVFDYSKKRQNVAKETLRTIDGIDYYLYADSKINSASNVQLTTLGTHYIKFHLDNPMTVNVYSDNKKYYIGSECSTENAAKLYESTGDGEFSLAAGDWYINGSGEQVKITKIEFLAPKCEQPVITTQPQTKLTFGAGEMTATVVADEPSDGGTLKYQWYNAADDSEVAGATESTLTTTEEGTYYVIVTNTLADHSNNSVKSEEATLGHRALNNATLIALGYGDPATAITLEEDVYEYRVILAEGTVDVPALSATAAMDGYATVNITNATSFTEYQAVSTVRVIAEDGATEQLYTVTFVVKHVYTALEDVTGSTTWNWTGSADQTIDDAANKGTIIANYIEGDNFEKIEGKAGEYARRNQNGGVYQGTYLHFNTTVPGVVKFYFRAPSSGDQTTITVKNNGKSIVAGSTGNSFKWSKSVLVEGDVVVEIKNVKENGEEGPGRVQQIVFNATPDYTRDVRQGYYGTICLPNGGVMAGASIFEIAYKDASKIYFDEILSNEMVAGTPYIFLPNEGADKLAVFYTDEANASAGSKNGLVGSYTQELLDANGNNYILLNNQYCKVIGEAYVGANRAYFQLGSIPSPAFAPVLAPGARRVSMGMAGQNTATGVDQVQGDEVPTKMIINGQLFILRGEKMYDAQGRLVK